MFVQVFPIIAPVVLCALSGLLWHRLGGRIDGVAVSRLISQIGAPCLIVSSLTRVDLQPAALGEVGLACMTVLLLMSALIVLVLRVARLNMRIYYTPLLFANVGNMGLPLCLFAFGQPGLALALAWFMVNSVLHFSLGSVMMSQQNFWRALVGNPVIWAVLIAVVLVITHWALPIWLRDTVQLLGGFAIPLMLLMLGISLSQLRVNHLRLAFSLSLLRLFGGFACGLLACWLFDLEGVARGVVLIQASMPVAVFNYLFAKQFGQGEEEVAALVMMSTVLSFLSLPWLVQFALAGSSGAA